MSEAFGWQYGLDSHPAHAKQFYGVIGAATVVGLGINYIGISPIDALFWTAVINGFVAPPLLVLIMLISNNRKIMGERVNGAWLNVLGWLATILMFAAAIGLVFTFGQS
jgi:Mn2+/Fe2+ NRAMP family transporter